MTPWKRLSELERRVEATERLPPPKYSDNKEVNVRQILIDRIGLGLQKLTPKLLEQLEAVGYDNYIIDRMNSPSKVGKRPFQELKDADKIELTTEYIVFHNFRHKLKNRSRIEIAKLLADHFNLAKNN